MSSTLILRERLREMKNGSSATTSPATDSDVPNPSPLVCSFLPVLYCDDGSAGRTRNALKEGDAVHSEDYQKGPLRDEILSNDRLIREPGNTVENLVIQRGRESHLFRINSARPEKRRILSRRRRAPGNWRYVYKGPSYA